MLGSETDSFPTILLIEFACDIAIHNPGGGVLRKGVTFELHFQHEQIGKRIEKCSLRFFSLVLGHCLT